MYIAVWPYFENVAFGGVYRIFVVQWLFNEIDDDVRAAQEIDQLFLSLLTVAISDMITDVSNAHCYSSSTRCCETWIPEYSLFFILS